MRAPKPASPSTGWCDGSPGAAWPASRHGQGRPGTVGGAICGNAHFQGRLISEHVRSVRVLQPSGEVVDVPVEAMAFGYDRSRIQHSGEVVLSVLFAVTPGASPEALRAAARTSLAFRKRTQPLHQSSAGCIFQNPGPDDPVPAGVPRSAGALIDRAGLEGRTGRRRRRVRTPRQLHCRRAGQSGRGRAGARR